MKSPTGEPLKKSNFWKLQLPKSGDPHAALTQVVSVASNTVLKTQIDAVGISKAVEDSQTKLKSYVRVFERFELLAPDDEIKLYENIILKVRAYIAEALLLHYIVSNKDKPADGLRTHLVRTWAKRVTPYIKDGILEHIEFATKDAYEVSKSWGTITY